MKDVALKIIQTIGLIPFEAEEAGSTLPFDSSKVYALKVIEIMSQCVALDSPALDTLKRAVLDLELGG